jgi:hypothetical protein
LTNIFLFTDVFQDEDREVKEPTTRIRGATTIQRTFTGTFELPILTG